LGILLGELGRHEEALAALRKAITLKPDDPELHWDLAHELLRKEDFAAARAAYQRCHEVSAKHPTWQRRSVEWMRRTERLARLAPRAAAVLQGKDRPADADEQLLFAFLYQLKSRRLWAASARFWVEAFAAQPAWAEDLVVADRYSAACAAALAGCGKGAD